MKNYKNYVIQMREGTQRGLFFRSPIQKVAYDAYYGSDSPNGFCSWSFLNRLKKSLGFRLFQRLLGNSHVVDNIESWSEGMDWAGFSANILCFPIHFKREFRALTAQSQNADDNIQSVHSWGYESEFENCSGGCAKEITLFKMRNGKTIREVKKENYCYTYSHIIENLIDGKKVG